MIERHRTDTVQYHIEMQEQERILARETKLKAFTLTRFTDRSELEEQAKKKRGIRGERICAAGTANQEPAELASGLFIVIYSTEPQRQDLSPFQRLLHPTFTLQLKRMNSDNHPALCVPLGQREGWGGCPYVQPCLLLSYWGGIPLCLAHSCEDSDFPALFQCEIRTPSAPLALLCPVLSTTPNPSAPAWEGSVKGTSQGHTQPGLSFPQTSKQPRGPRRAEGSALRPGKWLTNACWSWQRMGMSTSC